MVRLPEPLQPGATIGVIAPSSAAKRKYVHNGLEYLRQRGYQFQTAPHLSRGKFYLAGPDRNRLEQLEKFLLNPEIDAIICVRGGYGLLRIIDKIAYDKLASIPPKILVGYSDITALQMALLARLGWVTYTGPMVASEMGQAIDPYTEEWLWKVITEHPYPLPLKNPPGEKLRVFREGSAQGRLIAGCLSLITPLLGTPYAPSFQDAILVIEDVGERSYHLDKQLHALRIHGVLDQISGLVIGRFEDCFPKNPARSFTLEDFLTDILEDRDIPVLTNLAYGHIKRRLTLPIGLPASLETSPATLTIHPNE